MLIVLAPFQHDCNLVKADGNSKMLQTRVLFPCGVFNFDGNNVSTETCYDLCVDTKNIFVVLNLAIAQLDEDL